MAMLIVVNRLLDEEAVVESVSPTTVRWRNGEVYDLDKAGRLIGSGGWRLKVRPNKTEE